MSSKRIFLVMIVIVALLGVGIVAATAIGSLVLQKQSQKLMGLKLDSRVLDEQQLSLSQAKKDIEKFAELEKEAKAIVPQDKDQAQAAREIVKIADQSGIKLAAISFPASLLGTTPAPTVNTPSSGTPPPKATTPPVTQVKPVENIPGVYVMEITIQQDAANPVPYTSLIDFLSRLEQNRRTAQVASVTIQPSSQTVNRLTFSLVVNVYIKP